MDAWRKLRFYLRYTWRSAVLRRPEPLIYGIAITDRCNLSCRGCHVANTGRRDMTWTRLVRPLRAPTPRVSRGLLHRRRADAVARRRAHVEDAVDRGAAHRLLPRARLHERHARAGLLGRSGVGQHGRPARHLRDSAEATTSPKSSSDTRARPPEEPPSSTSSTATPQPASSRSSSGCAHAGCR